MKVMTYKDGDVSESTTLERRARSEAGRVLSALARNMEHDNGLRCIFQSVAVMADYELWGIEDRLNNMRTHWSESCAKYQADIDELMNSRKEDRNERDKAYATRDAMAADVATLQNERDKLLRELADTQEAYRKFREVHEK